MKEKKIQKQQIYCCVQQLQQLLFTEYTTHISSHPLSRYIVSIYIGGSQSSVRLKDRSKVMSIGTRAGFGL